MNEGNLVQRIDGIVTGDMFLREIELPMMSDVRNTSDGVVLTGSTAPTLTTAGASFDDGDTALLHFDIPQDYAQNKDICALRLHLVPSADAAHTTDMGVTSAQSLYRDGAAVDSTAATAAAETATASTGALVREAVLDLSGSGYEPGDHIIRTLDGNNSGATEIILLGIDLIYGGTLAAYDEDNDRHRDLG